MIFLDTNVVSETMRLQPDKGVLIWLAAHDARLALSTVALGEIAFGIELIRPDQRAARLEVGLGRWRHRLAGRIFPFDEAACLIYGRLMGAARRTGSPISAPDGMIAAIALCHDKSLATRNTAHFAKLGLTLIDPWTGAMSGAKTGFPGEQ